MPVSKRLKGAVENPIDVMKSNLKRLAGKSTPESRRRESVCKNCDSRVPDNLLGGYMCNECFCPIKSLVHSKKGCELNKW